MTVEYLAECSGCDAVAVFVAPLPHDLTMLGEEMVAQDPAEGWTAQGTAKTGPSLTSPLCFQHCLEHVENGKIAARAITKWATANDKLVAVSSAG